MSDPATQFMLDASAEFSVVVSQAISRLDELYRDGRLSDAAHAELTARLRPAVVIKRAGGVAVLEGGRR
jgi:hypothetical protein